MSRARRQRRALAQLDWLVLLEERRQADISAWGRAEDLDLSYLWFTYRHCGDRGTE
jgi:hypothetical protein